jgi:hypothetical protein
MALPTQSRPTKAEFDDWLTPARVLEVLASMDRFFAIEEVLRRACADFAHAAGNVSFTDDGTQRRGECALILADWWRRADATDVQQHGRFWVTGGLTVRVADRRSLSGTSVFEFFDVRFEPAGIYAMPGAKLPTLAIAPATEPTSTQAPPEPPNKGPPVPAAQLQEFWELFRKLNPAATEPQLVAAANAMFPRHSVSRQRLRDLRGRQPSGPKRRVAE